MHDEMLTLLDDCIARMLLLRGRLGAGRRVHPGERHTTALSAIAAAEQFAREATRAVQPLTAAEQGAHEAGRVGHPAGACHGGEQVLTAASGDDRVPQRFPQPAQGVARTLTATVDPVRAGPSMPAHPGATRTG